jgi:hypothetical protein
MTEESDEAKKNRPDVRDKPMPTEDKALLAVLGILAIGALVGIRWVLSGMFGLAVGASAGVGFRDAFIAAIVVSVLLMIVFAVVAGDGALGELTTMVIGFFVMVALFTVSIALIL